MCFTWWNTARSIPTPFSHIHRRNLAATDGVIAGNHGALPVLEQHGYRGPAFVVPQVGVDDIEYSPGLADDDLIERYALAGQFVIGFIGRLTVRKGVDTLIRAFAQIHLRNCRLLLVGEGPERAPLEQLAAEVGVAGQVSFAGSVPRSRIPALLRCMNVLVLPSTRAQWEQFGHVLIEAMASGVPVVGSTSGEIPHVIGDAGLVFPIGDSEALAAHLARVASEPSVAITLRERGLERVRQHYSHAAIARQLASLYRSVCAGPASDE